MRAQLGFCPEEPVNVIISVTDKSVNEDVVEAIAGILNDNADLYMLGGFAINATVNPPDVRLKLTAIAAIDEIRVIEVNEPLMPIEIPKLNFR